MIYSALEQLNVRGNYLYLIYTRAKYAIKEENFSYSY